MSWRREVYLYAAESISRLSGLVGRIADLNVPDQELSRVFQDDMAKITRIQVIANDKTVAAVNAFTGKFAIVYLQLFVDRALLVKIPTPLCARPLPSRSRSIGGKPTIVRSEGWS